MKNRFMGLMFGVVVLAFSGVGLAQAAQQPGAAGAIPRTPDGKPALSGTWTGGQVKLMDMTLTAWGFDKYIWNTEPIATSAEAIGYDLDPGDERQRIELDPVFHCYPPGMVRLGPPSDFEDFGIRAVEILQTPGMVIIVFERRNSIRYIYTDGREHPKLLEPTWNGHSIGRWDGDTFVVDTIGLRDEAWLNSEGHEHSTELHVVERFRRVAADTIEIERTLTDPIALEKPYTSRISIKLDPKGEVNENGANNDCTQFMVRKPAFGEGANGLMGISEHP